MKVLMVEPGKTPYATELKGDLKSMQKAVGGYIEGYYPFEDSVALVCNESGKIDGLPLNRAIYGENGQMVDIIAGNFFIAGLGKEDFTDLPDTFMQKYAEMFKHPEEIINLNGKITAVPMTIEEQGQIKYASDMRAAAETQSITPKRLFVDMDGVLAEFHPVDKIEELYEQGYFANLKPQQNVVDAVKLLCADSRFEVYILSSVLDSPYALEEKNQWLDTYLPEIDRTHRLFPTYGEVKQSIIPNGLQTTDTLLDDYSLNLNAWCPPGQAIKLMNGINGNHGTWQGMKVYSTASAQQIAETVGEYALGQDFRLEYRLLDRLRSDCEYFLGNGQGAEKHLWSGNVDAQIAKMRELYDMLPQKPEWLTAEEIDRYEQSMQNVKNPDMQMSEITKATEMPLMGM